MNAIIFSLKIFLISPFVVSDFSRTDGTLIDAGPIFIHNQKKPYKEKSMEASSGMVVKHPSSYHVLDILIRFFYAP